MPLIASTAPTSLCVTLAPIDANFVNYITMTRGFASAAGGQGDPRASHRPVAVGSVAGEPPVALSRCHALVGSLRGRQGTAGTSVPRDQDWPALDGALTRSGPPPHGSPPSAEAIEIRLR